MQSGENVPVIPGLHPGYAGRTFDTDRQPAENFSSGVLQAAICD